LRNFAVHGINSDQSTSSVKPWHLLAAQCMTAFSGFVIESFNMLTTGLMCTNKR